MNRTALVVTLAASLALAGCTPGPAPTASTLSIVTSTDVYASIASAVAGDRAEVTAIIDSPAIDPHSYEATARDRLALTEADIVVANGGGYDPFMDALLGDEPSQRVIVAVSHSAVWDGPVSGASASPADEGDDHEGHEHDGESRDADGHDHDHDHDGELNEHVWYDFETVTKVASAIAVALTELDPSGLSEYAKNAEDFAAEVDALAAEASRVAGASSAPHVLLTEPAPQYLAESIGAVNVTPPTFTRAIEGGFDVPPAALLEVLQLIDDGGADLVMWNEQTTGPELERVADAAREAGIPVVSVTETLPRGTDYVSWMTANLRALEEALAP